MSRSTRSAHARHNLPPLAASPEHRRESRKLPNNLRLCRALTQTTAPHRRRTSYGVETAAACRHSPPVHRSLIPIPVRARHEPGPTPGLRSACGAVGEGRKVVRGPRHRRHRAASGREAGRAGGPVPFRGLPFPYSCAAVLRALPRPRLNARARRGACACTRHACSLPTSPCALVPRELPPLPAGLAGGAGRRNVRPAPLAGARGVPRV